MHPFRVHNQGTEFTNVPISAVQKTPGAGAFSWSKALFGTAFTQIHDAFLAIRLCTLVADKLDNVPGLVNVYSLLLNITIKIVDLPIKNSDCP